MITADDLCEKFFSRRYVKPEDAENVRAFIHVLSDEAITGTSVMLEEAMFAYNIGVIIEDYRDIVRLNEYLRFARTVSDTSKSLGDVTRELVGSLHGYKELSDHEDYSLAENAVQRQCEALLRVAHAYRKRSQINYDLRESYRAKLIFPLHPDCTISSKELIDHLLAHPEDDAVLASLIVERDLMEWRDLQPFLPDATKPSSLTSGML